MSEKNKDHNNRWRNKTVSFRVSPEEWQQIEIAVKLSGLTKQGYITSRLLCRDIIVQGNPRVYKALRNELESVLGHLERVQGAEEISLDLLDTIDLISVTIKGLKEAI